MKNRKIPLTLTVAAATIIGLAAPAFAQETPPPATPEPPPAAHHARAASSSGGNVTGLGVGAAAFVAGPIGPEVVYDFGIRDPNFVLGPKIPGANEYHKIVATESQRCVSGETKPAEACEAIRSQVDDLHDL